MPKMILEREIKYKTYRTRKDIPTSKKLLEEILTYNEVFYCIFRNASNPIIEIKVYDPESSESLIFTINTKYQRRITSEIRNQYEMLLRKNPVLRNIDNIAEVIFNVKGSRYGNQTIYSNSDVPWRHSTIFT